MWNETDGPVGKLGMSENVGKELNEILHNKTL